jgi:phage regulator Rha-like protein
MTKGHKGRQGSCIAPAGLNLSTSLIQPEQIQQVILLIRGKRVMLDRHLAALYGVRTKNLNKAVRRNTDRFPEDFMFQLTVDEAQTYLSLRFQIGTLKRGQHLKYLPYAFTQEGVAMLSSVLRSPRAVQVNIAIMRVFVRLRETLALHRELVRKLDELERKIEAHDDSIRTLFEAIRELGAAPKKPDREIGFHGREGNVRYRVNGR